VIPISCFFKAKIELIARGVALTFSRLLALFFSVLIAELEVV
jgi:hypothetical protein